MALLLTSEVKEQVTEIKQAPVGRFRVTVLMGQERLAAENPVALLEVPGARGAAQQELSDHDCKVATPP